MYFYHFCFRCQHGGRTKTPSNRTQTTECNQNWQRLVCEHTLSNYVILIRLLMNAVNLRNILNYRCNVKDIEYSIEHAVYSSYFRPWMELP